MLEIGPYQGRSTAILAWHLAPRERLVACDLFDDSEDPYPLIRSPESVRRHVYQVNPDLPDNALEIISGDSVNLAFEPGRNFRFAHIDGGHSLATALHDLRLCAKHLVPEGVIAVDDYEHPSWPGVTEAVGEFLAESPTFSKLADLNRSAESGRKLYLYSTSR